MKRRAGIFDPWRQSEAPEVEEPQKAVRILEPGSEGEDRSHCVQFPGQRAGLNVWLSEEPEDPSKNARAILVDLIHRLYITPDIAEVLTGWRIYIGRKEEPNAIVLGDDKAITVVSPVEGEFVVRRAIDSLALALREIAANKPSAGEVITALRVKPYVK